RLKQRGRRDAPGGVDRRALLVGGVAGAAGIAGLIGAQPAAADATSAGPVVFGPPPSPNAGDDDTPALQAALYAMGPGGGTLLLPTGTYQLRSLLYVPTRGDLQGTGGG